MMGRYIIIHKTNPHWEAGAVPDAALIARVGSWIGQVAKAGRFLAGEGLAPSSQGVRLRFAGGERTVLPGPFERGAELPAAFTILRVASLDAAIVWAAQYAEISGDAEIDIRPLHEPWDIGIGSPPEGDPFRRYMVMSKATPATESGESPSNETRSRLCRLIADATRSGVHIVSERMEPSRRGRRYNNSNDGKTFYDGPFAESKELIGGYVIVTEDSLEDACRWVPSYMDVVDADEVDVRALE
jgi:hypothetical protein